MRVQHPYGKALLGLVLAVGLAGAGSAWCYHTTRPDYQLRQGQEALVRGDVDRAERLAERLEAAGYVGRAHLLRGDLRLHQKRLNDAIREYNQIPPDEEETLVEASLIYGLAFLSIWQEDRAEERLRYVAGARAEALLRYVARARPENVDAHRGLAALAYDRGAMNEAIAHAQKWAELDDRDGQPHRFLGLIYKDLPADQEAAEHYRAALARELKPAIRRDTVVELAEVLVRDTEYAEALALLDRELGPGEGPPAAAELRGECLYSLGRGAEAAALLEKARQPNPSPRWLRLRAQIHADAGEVEAGAALLERALKIDRHDCACRYQLAQAYERLGRGADAVGQRRLLAESQRAFRELSELNQEAILKPRDAEIRRRLAALCEQLDKPKLAQMWLQAAAACQEVSPPPPRNPHAPDQVKR